MLHVGTHVRVLRSTWWCISDVACLYTCACVTQYMVVYQCIVAQASMAAFFVDGSSLNNLQVWFPYLLPHLLKPQVYFTYP